MTALFLANKLEESPYTGVSSFVAATAAHITKEKILEFESRMLVALDYRLLRPVASQFLRYFADKAGTAHRELCMAK